LNLETVGAVAGLSVRCTGDSPGFLERAAVTLFEQGHQQSAQVHYHVERHAQGAWTLLESGVPVATSLHEENLFALVRTRLPAQVEALAPDSFWLHAAAMQSPTGVCVLLAGRAGIGKSTAALMLSRAGWRYLADDRVLVHPAERTAIGMNWAISMSGPVQDFAFLRSEGYSVYQNWWVGDDGTLSSTLVVPPRDRVVRPPGPVAVSACVVLARGPAGVETRSAGEMLPWLWPQRIERGDGRDPCTPAQLAQAISALALGVLATERARELPGVLEEWLARVVRP
jgi:hypothetical protein